MPKGFLTSEILEHFCPFSGLWLYLRLLLPYFKSTLIWAENILPLLPLGANCICPLLTLGEKKVRREKKGRRKKREKRRREEGRERKGKETRGVESKGEEGRGRERRKGRERR